MSNRMEESKSKRRKAANGDSSQRAITALEALESARDSVRPSERQVIDSILRNTHAVQWMTLGELARAAGVSEPTVLRCCRALGVSGFKDFKVWLTQSLANETGKVHRRISEQISAKEIVSRVFAASIEELSAAASALSPEVIEGATSAIVEANRIAIFATGSSNVAALDVFQQFNRYGLSVNYSPDSHIQTQTAATLGPADLSIVISFTGGTKDNIRAAETSMKYGARCMAITRMKSPLSRAVDITINVDPLEDTFVFSPMSARVAQLVTCDVLCAAVGLALGSSASSSLRRAKESLRELWVDQNSADMANDRRE